jgi:hypothetical protein
MEDIETLKISIRNKMEKVLEQPADDPDRQDEHQSL